MSGEVVDLGAHENMTVPEALAVATRKPWENVIVLGYAEGSNGLVVVSSHMPRETALWLIEHAKLHVLDRL